MQKINRSDTDICIIKDRHSKLGEFSDINWFSGGDIGLHYFENLPDIIKFRVFSEGKILALNDKQQFLKLRRRFLHAFRDNYLFYEKNMKKVMQNV